MKFDKKVLGSGFVAAFSLFLTVASVSGDHVTTKTEPDSQTVELTAEPIPKSNKIELVSAELKQDNTINEVKEAAITDQSKAEAEEKKENEPEEKKSMAQEKKVQAEAETTEKEETEVEAKAERAEADEKKENEPEAKEEQAKAEEKKENEPEAKSQQAEATEKEETKTEKLEVAKAKETEAQAEKAEGEEKIEKDSEVKAEKTKANEKAKKKKKKQAAEKQETAKNELVESGIQEVSPWAEKLMPNVEEYLNIRAEASEESELVGKIHKGAAADILEQGDGWTKISSGSVEGYVKDEYCVTGLEAESLANELGTTYATATTGGVRVRQAESSAEDTPILDVLEEGGKIKVDKGAEAAEGWVPVKVDDQVGYISEEFVTVELELGKAISIEEEQAAIAAAEAEAEAKRKAEQEAAQQQSSSDNSSSGNENSSSGSSTQQREAVAASYDDVTLLGALIQCEAGSEPYEGQLAVGAVVMNRLRCGYAGSISGVIYQSGQFTPASNGMLSGVLSSGVSGSCIQAAQEAINGVDNVNGATSFRRAGSAEGLVIGNHVFF